LKSDKSEHTGVFTDTDPELVWRAKGQLDG
jgi:hypothetical protein